MQCQWVCVLLTVSWDWCGCDGGESVKALPCEIVRTGVKGDGIELNFGELNEGIGV